MRPAVKVLGKDHVIYGADCGVPCSTHETMEKNRMAVMEIEEQLGIEIGTVGENGFKLFPAAAKRVSASKYVMSMISTLHC